MINAIFAAVGKRIRNLPIGLGHIGTIDRIRPFSSI
jgi:CO/xanthine dehydrogenase Mo-binding subunit